MHAYIISTLVKLQEYLKDFSGLKIVAITAGTVASGETFAGHQRHDVGPSAGTPGREEREEEADWGADGMGVSIRVSASADKRRRGLGWGGGIHQH